MSSSDNFVLVTGASGYLGSHVLHRLVQEGYRVRGAVRSSKVAGCKVACEAVYGEGKVEFAAVDDIVAGDFTEALKDITAVIHVASPSSSPDDMLTGAIESATKVLRQAQKAGVKRFSFISTITATIDLTSDKPPSVLSENDWNNATKEQALEPSRSFYFLYHTGKTLAEKEVWKFAEEFQDVNVTVVNPPYFVGPNAPCQSIRPGAANALSSNLLLYNLLIPESKLDNFTYGIVDVKDVAAALVAGIRTPGRNRILLSGEWFEIKDALELIANARPELKDRLITHIGPSQPRVFVDNTRAYEILGLKPVGSWKDNLLETIDYLVKLEKDWVEVGVDIETKLKATFWRK